MKPKSKKNLIKKIMKSIVLIILIYISYQFYQKNNFNEFIRSESKLYTAEFKRDNEVKFSNMRSYKIKSDEFDDAMFSKKVKVSKDTPYKVSCYVKTENVEQSIQNSGIGAQISIKGTNERSVAISGSSDWQKVELLFNSKNRDEIDIGFRLGGYLGEAKGVAWFSDFVIEEGTKDTDNEWKFACLIFENTDVNINDKQICINVTKSDIIDIEDTIKRFEKSCEELSEGKMSANCEIFKIEEPITTLSYDTEFGYFVSQEDIENKVKDIIENGDFDHIFVIVKLGDEIHQKDIQINDWIGLGSMDYYGIGYSNIRLPNDSDSYIYRYNTRINQFPEEVFLHEFLHSLERNAKDYGYEIPALHDYEKYGYKNESILGEKKWYRDYMNKNINSEGEKIGLPNEVYTLKPAKKRNFEYSYKINEFKEPSNIIEEIRGLFKNIFFKLKYVFGGN